MHFPRLYRRKEWQRFFVGCLLGAIVAYILFVFIHGQTVERLLEEKVANKSRITELENEIELLQEDVKDLDEQTTEPLTVNKIQIILSNEKDFKFDRLMSHELKESIRQDLDPLLGERVTTIGESYQLLITALENKSFTIDDSHYGLIVEHLIISEQLTITLQIKLLKD